MVLLVTDGLDREGASGIAFEARRLRKSCRRLIWLNPLLRYEKFAPRAAGIRALLPEVDEHQAGAQSCERGGPGQGVGARAARGRRARTS